MTSSTPPPQTAESTVIGLFGQRAAWKCGQIVVEPKRAQTFSGLRLNILPNVKMPKEAKSFEADFVVNE